MQKRLYKIILITVSVAVIIFGISSFGVCYKFYSESASSELKTIAGILADEEKSLDEICDLLKKKMSYDVRLTFIDMDGKVLYDNYADVTNMENHSDRKEFIEAMEMGYGEDIRSSKTLGESTYYYAIKYKDGVLRFARERSSFFTVFIGIISVFICMGGLIVLVSVLVSVKLSEKITTPLHELIEQLDITNTLNIDEDIIMETDCEELVPIIKNTNRLRHRLHKYIKQLQETDEIRREFTANVSHELKTPLTTIKGFGEMLENGIITAPSDVKKYGGIIFRDSTRLLMLINDIIRLSEIEEKNEKTLLPVDLLKAADETIEILAYKADQHKISVASSGKNVCIIGEAGYIGELMLNLIDNAIKYNNDGGKVWVNISENENNAIISVKDNGIGIPLEHQARIFERFYRVDKSRSKQTGGTGLGLSIVKHIVNFHSGKLELKSAVNGGTEIIIRLPKQQNK